MNMRKMTKSEFLAKRQDDIERKNRLKQDIVDDISRVHRWRMKYREVNEWRKKGCSL